MANASDFAPEANIQSKSNKNRKGTVIGNKLSDGDQVVAVEWADGTLGKVNVNDIQVCLSIEEEFKLIQNEVNDKLNKAANLIREAADLAEANGKGLHDNDPHDYDRLFDTDAIEGAMGDAGWNTSSWHC